MCPIHWGCRDIGINVSLTHTWPQKLSESSHTNTAGRHFHKKHLQRLESRPGGLSVSEPFDPNAYCHLCIFITALKIHSIFTFCSVSLCGINPRVTLMLILFQPYSSFPKGTRIPFQKWFKFSLCSFIPLCPWSRMNFWMWGSKCNSRLCLVAVGCALLLLALHMNAARCLHGYGCRKLVWLGVLQLFCASEIWRKTKVVRLFCSWLWFVTVSYGSPHSVHVDSLSLSSDLHSCQMKRTATLVDTVFPGNRCCTVFQVTSRQV